MPEGQKEGGAAKPEQKAAPQQPQQKPTTQQPQALSPSQTAALVERLNKLENEMDEMRGSAPEATPAVEAPTLLELSRSFGKDVEATANLVPSKAKKLLESELKDGDELIDYAVLGPYLVGVLGDNGRKIAVEHDLEVHYTPAVGEKPSAQMTDEEYLEKKRQQPTAKK